MQNARTWLAYSLVIIGVSLHLGRPETLPAQTAGQKATPADTAPPPETVPAPAAPPRPAMWDSLSLDSIGQLNALIRQMRVADQCLRTTELAALQIIMGIMSGFVTIQVLRRAR